VTAAAGRGDLAPEAADAGRNLRGVTLMRPGTWWWTLVKAADAGRHAFGGVQGTHGEEV
jgi:hypothetical protein